MYRQYFKRALDVAVSVSSLVVGSPALAAIATIISVESPGGALFRQQRVGRDGRRFDIIKFRTMRSLDDSTRPDGTVIDNEDRVTRSGRFLRASGLDELPQLVNVITGDMSLIGPRPTLPYQVDRYTAEQRKRLTVRPGLTGLAQVRGRNELTWEEKIAYDLEYARSITFRHDLSIIAQTFCVIFRRRGVSFTRTDALSTHDNGYWRDI